MKVLVTAASKHGSTVEIAAGIEEVLMSAGLDTSLAAPERVTSLAGYDAVVLGSAVYAGHWMESAKEFVARNLTALLARPVWLFSSGPIGDPAKPLEVPGDVARILEATQAREHRVFAGRLMRRDLGLGERAVAAIIGAPEGDFRSWTEIEAWALGIARVLQKSPPGNGRASRPASPKSGGRRSS